MIKMNIHIRYFASLREIVGQDEEQLAVPDNSTIADIRTHVQARFPAAKAVLERSVNAVNRAYMSAETSLHEGDELVFIPPVGGGTMQEEAACSQSFN